MIIVYILLSELKKEEIIPRALRDYLYFIVRKMLLASQSLLKKRWARREATG
jgi:hypothetical protein